MGFLKNNNTAQALSPRQQLETKYSSSRANILLVVIFSAINVFLLVTNSNTYFLFSAYIPFLLADIGMAFCGKYPAEYYEGNIADYDFFDEGFFIAVVAIAVAVILLYLLSWLFSKKNVGWMIFSLVFFAVDTAVMLYMTGVSSDMILDIVFHAWVIVSLVSGVISYFKLKKLPEEPIEVPLASPEEEQTNV